MKFIFNHDDTEAINCTAVRKFSIILDDELNGGDTQ